MRLIQILSRVSKVQLSTHTCDYRDYLRAYFAVSCIRYKRMLFIVGCGCNDQIMIVAQSIYPYT